MTLGNLLRTAAAGYPQYRSGAVTNRKHEVYRLVTGDIPDHLHGWITLPRGYKVEGSTGRGNVTPAPWIAILDRTITESAQTGYYPVYLFTTDFRELYLSIALGVTAFERIHGKNAAMVAAIEAAAAAYLQTIPTSVDRTGLISGPIEVDSSGENSLHKGYGHSNIVAIRYSIDALPEDEVLQRDFERILSIYDSIRTVAGGSDELEDIANDAAPEVVQITGLPFTAREHKKPGETGTHAHDRRNKAAKKVGDRGEEIVVRYEQTRLTDAGRPDLAQRVKWLAKLGEQPGWDVLSFETDGAERRIEVKATTGKTMIALELTANEWKSAQESPAGRYWLYLVTKTMSKKPQVEFMQDPAALVRRADLSLEPCVFRLNLHRQDSGPAEPSPQAQG
jgi:hypothetical protein